MFSSVPLDVIKNFIVPNLDKNSFMAFISTCTRYYNAYTPLKRLQIFQTKKFEIQVVDGKLKCYYCDLPIRQDRYESHIKRCIPNSLKCILCECVGMTPQIGKIQTHPSISCLECGKGISKQSIGCLQCEIFYCGYNRCNWCQDTFISCRKHICSSDPVDRWYRMLYGARLGGSHMNCFGIMYESRRLIFSRNRIIGKTIFGNNVSCFVNWIVVDSEKLDGKIPNVDNGYDIFFIVDKDSLKISDSDLIAAHYGIAGKTNQWIVYK